MSKKFDNAGDSLDADQVVFYTSVQVRQLTDVTIRNLPNQGQSQHPADLENIKIGNAIR